LKRLSFFITFLITFHLQGQIPLRDEAILIGEVEIRAKSDRNDFMGFKSSHIDSSIIVNYNQRTLADLISENSIIHIKTYGSGGLASPSFRGTGPGHTQITWNNVNLNNPMVGQFDLSLVPAGFIDDVNIYYGGGSMGIHNGGFGGVINLETNPGWDDRELVYLNPAMGSFGRISGLVKVKAGSKDFHSVTKAFLRNSDNNFRYINSVSGPTPLFETRENSEVRQKGFIQEFYFRNSTSNFSARIWYQSAARNLPVPIISPALDPPEKQFDESLRAMFEYGSVRGITGLNATAAFISDKLNYTNGLASVDSRNLSKRIILKGRIERMINNMVRLELSLNDEFNIINTNNYAGLKSRNLLSADAVAEADLTQWLGARILVRELVQDKRILMPDFSAGTEIRPFREKYYFIRASFSKNSKIPTLNDMYWSPGGNPGLKNETGYSSEITWEMTSFPSGSLKIRNDFTIFRNNINNMIQWHPGEYSYWEAANIGNIITSGLESGMDISYSFREFNASLNTGYSYTKAAKAGQGADNTALYGKQLVYIPANIFNAILRLNWHQFYSAISTGYTGKRYLTADNSQYLPPYLVSDLNIGTKLNTGHASFGLNVLIENIFSVSYQNIAYYPMPGRSFLVSIVCQLKK
jgi:iron complex outermembrane receptor protein